MTAHTRAIRVEQVAQQLSAVAVDISTLVRDAYAEGYRDGLAHREADERQAALLALIEPGPIACRIGERPHALVDACDADDVAQRRPTHT